MKKPTKHIVSPESHGLRLDVFLSEALETSRSQAQKLIEDGLVLVNDKEPKKAGDKIKTGDTVVILNVAKRSEGSPKKQGDSSVASLPQNDGVALTPSIIAETPDYVVLEKPAGLLVHPTQAEEKNTLTAWLLKKYPKIKTVGDDPTVRPGIVHRLDKEASGLLVVAKTQAMFDHLKNQFKNRTVEKEYWALAHGKVPKDWDIITFPIARGENADRMAARPVKGEEAKTVEGEKEAKTEFLVEKRFVNCTLLRVTLHTGRMHQIRVHMLAYNSPLVGDPLYFQKKRKKNLDEKCGRLFLHSTRLGFTDLEGNKQTFDSPLPDSLQTFLQTLN